MPFSAFVPTLKRSSSGGVARLSAAGIPARLWASACLLGLAIPALAVLTAIAQETRHAAPLAETVAAAAFNIVFFALILRLVISLPVRWMRTALVLLYGLTASFIFVSVYHFLLYRQPLGDPSVAAIIDTNPGELTEFVRWALNLDNLAMAAAAGMGALLLLTIVHPFRLARLDRAAFGMPLVGAVAVMAGLGIYERSLARNNQLLFFPRSVLHAVWNKRAVMQAHGAINAVDIGPIEARAGEATHVLIIGEAATRRHMSLYGYGRKTSPRLDDMRPELNVALDVCSSRGATAPALQEMLTFASRANPGALYTTPTLLRIMKAAGYKVFWLSNQQMYGKFDNWSTILSMPADTRVLVNKVGWSEGASHDGQLIEPFEAALSDPAPRKFIVIHLLGAHADYKLRYPPEFERFPAPSPPPSPVRPLRRDVLAKYNAYDNALLYQDHVVAELIARMRSADRGSVTFVSDHGEALAEHSDFIGHIDGPTPKQVYEIPLLFWMSPAMREILGERLTFLHANLGRPFQTDALIHNLLDLYGVRHPMLQPEQSLFSPTYKPSARYCDTLPAGPWTSP